MPRKTVVAFVVAVLASVGCGPGTSAFGAPERATAANSAREFMATFSRLSAAAQWDSLSRLYSPDTAFRWIEDGSVRYRSAAIIRETLQSMPAGMTFSTTYDSMDVAVPSPGIAVVSTLFTTTAQGSPGGGFQFGGAMTVVLGQAAGSDGWLIVAGHTSSVPASGRR